MYLVAPLARFFKCACQAIFSIECTCTRFKESECYAPPSGTKSMYFCNSRKIRKYSKQPGVTVFSELSFVTNRKVRTSSCSFPTMTDTPNPALKHAGHLIFSMINTSDEDHRPVQTQVDGIIRTEVTRCAPNYMGPRAPDNVYTWAAGRGFQVGSNSTPSDIATYLHDCLNTICRACGDRPYWGLQSDFRRGLFFIPAYRKETELYDPVTKRMVPV